MGLFSKKMDAMTALNIEHIRKEIEKVAQEVIDGEKTKKEFHEFMKKKLKDVPSIGQRYILYMMDNKDKIENAYNELKKLQGDYVEACLKSAHNAAIAYRHDRDGVDKTDEMDRAENKYLIYKEIMMKELNKEYYDIYAAAKEAEELQTDDYEK